MGPQTLALEAVDHGKINDSIRQAHAYVEQQASRLAVAVKTFEDGGIQSDLDMARANEILTDIVAARRSTEERWEAPIAFFRKAHQTLTGWRKRGTDLFDGLRQRLERPMKEYINEREKLQRKRQQEAERAAATLRKAKEAEARRLAKQGDIAAALDAKAVAEAIIAPVLPTDDLKLEGNTIRKVWTITITDRVALVKAIADGTAPLEVIKQFDESFLKRQAIERGQEGELYPGVIASREISFSVKA